MATMTAPQLAKTAYVKTPRVAEDKQVPVTSFSKPWLKIDSLQELNTHQKEIIERIAQVRNGANLFMANPFMLLADIGVQLSDKARAEIVKLVPQLSAVSPTPYNALKASKDQQQVTYHLHGLFSGRTV